MYIYIAQSREHLYCGQKAREPNEILALASEHFQFNKCLTKLSAAHHYAPHRLHVELSCRQ